MSAVRTKGWTAQSNAVVMFVTAPSSRLARKIGRVIVEKRLAACCNIVSGIQSIFFWQGKIEKADESLIIIKTSRNRVYELAQEVRRLHTYTVPEIIVLPVVMGASDYLEWINETTRKVQ